MGPGNIKLTVGKWYVLFMKGQWYNNGQLFEHRSEAMPMKYDGFDGTSHVFEYNNAERALMVASGTFYVEEYTVFRCSKELGIRNAG